MSIVSIFVFVYILAVMLAALAALYFFLKYDAVMIVP